MNEKYAYIGRKRECKCAVAIIVDQPEYRRDVAKQVAEFIRDGYVVEYVDLEQGIQLVHSCPHRTPVANQAALL
jgi:hypothetical protein